ncbi:hypothetical protein [Clostridium sp.]|jgi:type I restriction enzyme S subunit|uniref:hypothetical protein n=1 Tax=Clostridium sp. TaxID=1506 RepID=UPI002587A7A1|nr:hypothetical protein [Clostridium sp.]MDF2505580.1 restriction endonuclease subunit [Clostridium sp.]
MDGLEAVEISFAQITKHKYYRLDNEYFLKQYLLNEAQIQSFGYKQISDIAYKITDFGAYSQTNFIELYEKGINFFRNQDVKENWIDFLGCAKISHNAYEKLTLKLEEGDILIPRAGTLGNAAVVSSDCLPATANQNLAVIRNLKSFLPNYVSTVLSSRLGKLQISRTSTGNVQQWLNLETISNIKIPSTSLLFQKQIQCTVNKGVDLAKKAANIYSQTEQFLLSELDMTDFTPSLEDVAVKLFSDSFGKSGRLDAEYYQPKYEDYMWHVKAYSGGYTTINDKFRQVTTKYQKTEHEYPYIEISDINVGDGSFSFNIIPSEKLPANAKIKVSLYDLLISKVRPYRGAVSIINHKIDNLIVSGAFTVLHEKSDYPVETLSVLLRTTVYKDWFLKWNVGTSYPVIKDEDVLNLPIPLFKDEIHVKIKENIVSAYILRDQSEQLLENAKRAVEIAIEQSEDKAIKWLENVSI